MSLLQSIDIIRKSTLDYLSNLLDEESHNFCNDLTDLVVALLENGDFDQIKVDMDPFLKDNTNVFIEWLQRYLKELRVTLPIPQNTKEEHTQEEERKEQEQKRVQKKQREQVAQEVPKIKKLVDDDNTSTEEQKDARANRQKRFGTANSISNDDEKEKKELPKSKKQQQQQERKKKIEEPQNTKKRVVQEEIPKSKAQPQLTIKDKSQATPPYKKVKTDNGSVVVQQDNDNFQVTITNKVPTAVMTKCFYYPKCTKTDCPYLHPDTACSAFPHCTYGASCRYIHPPCKYSDRCSKPGCPYTHSPFANVDCKNGFACPNKGPQCPYRHPGIACKFSVSCVYKASCLFSHAKVCKSGDACKTVGCKFAHVVKTTEKNEEQEIVNVNTDVEKLSESLAFTPPQDDTIDT